MSGSFAGRAAVVTGASSGIGRSIARALGASGMELWLVGRSRAELENTGRDIVASGGCEPHLAPLDVGEPGALARLIESLDHDYLFALINSAGVMYPEPILSADPSRWREMMAVNVLGPVEACRAAAIRMRAHGRPAHLINISSLAAKFDAGGMYGASKAALEMAGRTLRQELERDDIRVSTVVPGGFRTNLARGFTSDVQAAMAERIRTLGVAPERLFGDPDLIGRMVSYILEQPIDFNIGEVIVRPPVSLVF